VFYVVREGIRHTAMGGMKTMLTEEETWNIVAYVLAKQERSEQ
jgi:mono/diheme cytochrome c family protein